MSFGSPDLNVGIILAIFIHDRKQPVEIFLLIIAHNGFTICETAILIIIKKILLNHSILLL